MKKYFPILSETSCKLKWSWSTLYLSGGSTGSCHRASLGPLTYENFDNFHNTPEKIQARQMMLEGKWPSEGCNYCQDLEAQGGDSDRTLHNSIPGLVVDNPGELVSDPKLLEVFFNNTCNLACIYCSPRVSSKLDQEYRQYGEFKEYGIELVPMVESQITKLEPKLWAWLEKKFNQLERFHLLGGEPFYQRQFDTFLEFVENNPNPQCEFNLITNLMVPTNLLVQKIERIKKLIAKRNLKKFDLTVSIDCWGAEQEYVRYGLDLEQWETNFEYLIAQPWLTLNINQTISVLTIKTLPELLEKVNNWRKVKKIQQYFSIVEPPAPRCMHPTTFGQGLFDKDFEKILQLMPNTTENEKQSLKYMQSINNNIETSQPNVEEAKRLLIFLNEKDRRRNTSWQDTFPWLQEEFKKCGIVV